MHTRKWQTTKRMYLWDSQDLAGSEIDCWGIQTEPIGNRSRGLPSYILAWAA